MSTAFFTSAFAIPGSAPSMPPQPLCPGDRPLVLMPLRLETRFFPMPASGVELRVRIYPDRIHIDSHETDLTSDEVEWGQHYWQQDWEARSDRRARQDGWRQLADRFGAPRAAWIARVLRPLNAAQRPEDGGSPAAAPVFPQPAVATTGADSAWRRAPQARLLPDRWMAVLHSGGRVAVIATSLPVRRPLAVGPDPQAAPPDAQTEAAIASGERLAIDPGMKWMVDFAEAEAAGMAVRIPIPPESVTAGLDSLLVFGVSSRDVAETNSQLANLLDAHHYTDGLEFLRPGTATNNTEERRAGYNSDDPGHERSFAIEIDGSPLLDGSNASRVGAALGMSGPRIADTLGRIGRGAECDDLHMRSMNTALWQVGWGYFLSNMIGPETGLTLESIDWARAHFINQVRCFGPFPTLRCGPQPYGVLPVTSLDLWSPVGTDPVTGGPADPAGASSPQNIAEMWLRGLLLGLRDNVWRPALASVARVGGRQDPSAVDADLADVMRTDAVSAGYMTRAVLGRHFLRHLDAFINHTTPAPAGDSNPAQTALLERLGMPWQPRLSHVWHAAWSWHVSAPLVQAGEVSPWTRLDPDYIAALLAERRIDQLIGMRPDSAATGTTTSLLQTLLRHSMLREIAHAAASIAGTAPGNDVAALLRDEELVDLVTGAPLTQHWVRQLDLRVPAVTGSSTVREFLEGLTAFTAAPVAALGEFRGSLADLQTLDSEALLHLMQGTLDLSAHRLDAWVTSLATRRLSAMQADGAAGQYVGAYGWVENLKPTPAASTRAVNPPPGEAGPLVAPANDSGFIHAPSMTHGAAAALLRNAHLGPTGVPDPKGPFAIDLSSRRVREATRLLDGVRQGQPLGALLGYRVERSLHDAALDRFIAPLRRVAPLAARARQGGTAPVESIAANNVVDGLVLQRRWKEERDAVNSELLKVKPLPTPAETAAVALHLDRLDDAVDGLGDALTAEAAYQMARGNTTRLAGTLAAIAQGDGAPPELEVARMPRSGVAVTHRVVMLSAIAAASSTGGWLPPEAGIRSVAEPSLNFWASRLLGDPARVRCTIERLDSSTRAVAETLMFPLADLAVIPLDVVYGVEPEANGAAGGSSLSELEMRVLYHAGRRGGAFDDPAAIRLQHARPADLARGETTLFDVLEQARAIRRLLMTARGAGPDDLSPPERPVRGTTDLAELEARVVRAEEALDGADRRLNDVMTASAVSAEALRSALLGLGAFGVAPAVPVSAAGGDAVSISGLVRQAQAVAKSSAARLQRVASLRALPSAAEERARREQLLERMRAVFGSSFVVLPRFTLDPAAAAELAGALAASTQAQDGDPLAVHTWFARCARVRDGVARMGAPLNGAEILGAGGRLDLRVAQLPFAAPERWVGLPSSPGGVISPGKLSAVVQTMAPFEAGEALTGLWVDEWSELVPNSVETTALAFQFDLPDSCAPQSVLIAVPPVPGQAWTAETLRRVLMETLDLAKLRAVDVSLLGGAAQHLPALYLALNAADHAVSTDFQPLTA